VFREFEALWSASTADGQESGGWIIQMPANRFRLVPFENAEKVPCGLDIAGPPPPGTVAMVHTHPWKLWTVNPCGWLATGTPSEEDVDTLRRLGLSQGYVLDPGGIAKYTPTGGQHSSEFSTRLTRCGY
jgi:hypothetical protein